MYLSDPETCFKKGSDELEASDDRMPAAEPQNKIKNFLPVPLRLTPIHNNVLS